MHHSWWVLQLTWERRGLGQRAEGNSFLNSLCYLFLHETIAEWYDLIIYQSVLCCISFLTSTWVVFTCGLVGSTTASCRVCVWPAWSSRRTICQSLAGRLCPWRRTEAWRDRRGSQSGSACWSLLAVRPQTAEEVNKAQVFMQWWEFRIRLWKVHSCWNVEFKLNSKYFLGRVETLGSGQVLLSSMIILPALA